MKEYYECHITMLGEPEKIRPIIVEEGWTFSAIEGDPDLGPGLKCYATKHFNIKIDQKTVERLVHNEARHLNEYKNLNILRTKVEKVVYDDRSWGKRP